MASCGLTGGVSDRGVSRLSMYGIGKSAFGNIANPYFSMGSIELLGNVAETFPPAGGIGDRGFPLQAHFDIKMLCLRSSTSPGRSAATMEIQPLYDKLVCPFLNGHILFLYLVQIKPEKCGCVFKEKV